MNQRDASPTSGPSHGLAHVGYRLPAWRREALRTTLWLVPTVLVAAAIALFALTLELDQLVYHHHVSLPRWVVTGSADAGRQVLILSLIHI